MPLTDTLLRNAKPSAKATRLFDERGLYIEISPGGGKWWRWKYRYRGREKRLSFGVYPDVSLKAAREKRDEARRMLAAGTDPSANRQAQKSARVARESNSFEVVTREWFLKFSAHWALSHSKRVIRLFERDLFPLLGLRTIEDVKATELLPALRRIELRAPETAHRALRNCGQVFRYAISTGRASADPTTSLKRALAPVKSGHFAAVTDSRRLAEILRSIDGYKGTPQVSAALRLAPHLFVRPGELRSAEWKDFNLETAEWRYLVTKTNTQHIVPLSRQALEILRDLQPFTDNSPYVFPSARSRKRPMSDNALLAAMRNLGIEKSEVTTHGWRATARTILDEVLNVRPDLIEHQLAHQVRDANGRAYNRTIFLLERKKMMQQWSDYLDELKA
jgi:integrase